MRADNRDTAPFERDAAFGALLQLFARYVDAVDLNCKAQKVEALWITTDKTSMSFLRLTFDKTYNRLYG